MQPQMIDNEFENLKKDIAAILNKYSQENRSNTPDYMLADYMLGCLNVYENTISAREKWFGRPDPFKEINLK